MTHELYAEHAEDGVISAMLQSSAAIVTASTLLTAEMFYRPGHRTLFHAITALHGTGAVVDPITLVERLKATETLEQAGGYDTINYLIDVVTTAAHVKNHANIVRELAERRQVITTAEALMAAAQDRSISLQAAAQEATQALLPTAAATYKTGYRHIREIIPDVMQDIEAAANGTALGLSFGYRDIDLGTGGAMPGELVFVCAVPGACKTALALNIGMHAAIRGEGVAIVSAEMKDRALIKRVATARAQVSGLAIRKGALDEREYVRLGNAFGELQHLPLWVDDTALPQIALIQARARALKAQHPTIRWLIVDFIQLVQGSSDDEIRALELTNISYALKGLAKELDVVVIATCQVDASGVEKRPDPRPQLSDLRWSQGMREAADVVAMLFRPAMYGDVPDVIEMDVKKARDLPPFKATLNWIGQFMRVEDQQRQRTYQTSLPGVSP